MNGYGVGEGDHSHYIYILHHGPDTSSEFVLGVKASKESII